VATNQSHSRVVAPGGVRLARELGGYLSLEENAMRFSEFYYFICQDANGIDYVQGRLASEGICGEGMACMRSLNLPEYLPWEFVSDQLQSSENLAMDPFWRSRHKQRLHTELIEPQVSIFATLSSDVSASSRKWPHHDLLRQHS